MPLLARKKMKDDKNIGVEPKKIDIISIKKRKTEFVSLADACPEIAAEWHYEANKNMQDFYGHDISTPDKVSFSSGRKFWWICKNGHEFEASIDARRSKGSGCPYCAGKAVWPGFNDLATTNPAIAKEWHPTLNEGLKPTDVTSGSGKKVWWQCHKYADHIWATAISLRTGQNTKCPYCAGHKILAGFNDLATVNPVLTREWHPTLNGDLKPTEVGVGKYDVWWFGTCGHSFKSRVSNRHFLHQGCPYCAGLKALPGLNDLETVCPDLAKLWHPTLNSDLKPSNITGSSNKKVFWLGTCGHTWESSICNARKYGCPICSNRRVLVGHNDLASQRPDLAVEWSDKNGNLKPTDFTYGSNKKVWWQCSKNPKHTWMTSISIRYHQGTGCPYCQGKKVLPGDNDLATLFPSIAAEWHPTRNGDLKPSDVTSRSNKDVWWMVQVFNEKTQQMDTFEWKTSINNRIGRNSGCPNLASSHGEHAIRTCLTNNNILFKEQNMFPDRISSFGGLLKDDFAILNENNQVIATIEFNGEQHYKPIRFGAHDDLEVLNRFEKGKIRDKEKTDYLNKHHIPQLIIPYWEYDNISTLVQNFISTL